jgi:hypothetical protein
VYRNIFYSYRLVRLDRLATRFARNFNILRKHNLRATVYSQLSSNL